jgi:glycerol-3-phosphate O-acyltransferase
MTASLGNVWPDDTAGGVVFLLDSRGATERKILLRSIEEHRPNGARFDVLDASLRQEKPVLVGADSGLPLDGADSRYFVPLRVSWQPSRTQPAASISLRDALAREPGAFRQRLLERRVPRPYEIVVGQGATLGELKRRLHEQRGGARIEADNLAGFVSRSALLALDRSERRLRGRRYKIPRMITEEVLGRPRLKAALAEIARESGRSIEDVNKEARSYLAEMAAGHTTFGMDLSAALGRYMYTRAFDPQIDLPAADLERIRRLMDAKPVAFGFTHKSHVDGFMLITMFHDLNLTPLHFFGGINMSFLGLGTLMKKSGAIFIRRSFQDNAVYKAVFRCYIDYLGEKRFPLLWAMEGTRSRTGKLMPLRYGMINYVASAYVRDTSPDLVMMPIALVYDQVPEVGDYDALQAGARKRPESASWFVDYIRRLKKPHGKIHVRFGHGVQLSDFVDLRQPGAALSQRDVQKIAFALAVDVNSVTPITVNSLITYVMLAHGHQALTMDELDGELVPLREWIRLSGLPTTADVSRWDGMILDRSLQLLAAHGVIDIDGSGLEPVYAIAASAARKAAYYRNGMIHFPVRSAIAELTLLTVGSTGAEALEQFRREALHLRDLLKFEFFFDGREEFIRSLERELELRAPGWRDIVVRGDTAARELVSSMPVILGHGTLRPFLEAYLLVAEALSMLPAGTPVDGKTLLARSHSLGRQRLLQHRIRCEESVSSSYFENAIQLAESRDLLGTAGDVQAGRQQFLQELTDAVSRTRFLASLADSRRYTARPNG